MTKHPRLNDLVGLPIPSAHDSNRILDGNPVAVRIYEPHKELNTVLSELRVFQTPCEPVLAARREVRARRKGDDHVPPSGLIVGESVGGLELAVAIEKGKDIPFDVPLRMPAGTRFDVTRKGIVAKLTKCLTNFL